MGPGVRPIGLLDKPPGLAGWGARARSAGHSALGTREANEAQGSRGSRCWLATEPCGCAHALSWARAGERILAKPMDERSESSSRARVTGAMAVLVTALGDRQQAPARWPPPNLLRRGTGFVRAPLPGEALAEQTVHSRNGFGKKPPLRSNRDTEGTRGVAIALQSKPPRGAFGEDYGSSNRQRDRRLLSSPVAKEIEDSCSSTRSPSEKEM